MRNFYGTKVITVVGICMPLNSTLFICSLLLVTLGYTSAGILSSPQSLMV